MLLSQTEIVSEMIALVFQGIERLVLYFPPGPGATHKLVDILFGDIQICNPAKTLYSPGFCIVLPVFNKSDPTVLV